MMFEGMQVAINTLVKLEEKVVLSCLHDYFQSESGGKVSVKKVLQEVANNQAA